MKAYSVNPETRVIEEIDIQMQANTMYSFFNSILIDDLDSLNNHIIHTDANALSENKKSFFIGEQLVIGTALIIGKNGMQDSDVSISKKDLESLVRFDNSVFYQDALRLLASTDINLYRVFSVSKENEKVNISTEWVLFAFDMADDRTREYFITELKKVIENKEDVLAFIQKLGQLAINAAG